MKTKKLKIRPGRYDIHPELQEKFSLNLAIEWRLDNKKGEPLFCIKVNGNVMHKDGSLEMEPMPSSRTEEFIKSTRFPLEKAKVIAQKHIPKYLVEYFKQPHVEKFLNDHAKEAWSKKIKKEFSF